ncbi:MAG: TPM domain-containing protein [Nitritalea sp.]
MPQDLFSEDDRALLTAAIQEAERKTSGEIQVHIEKYCNEDVLDRAAEVFDALKMQETAARNAVLFYLATGDKKFAILGDAGINAVVEKGFWDDIKEEMLGHFKSGAFTRGLELGILRAGKALSTHFPYADKGDKNELPDDISFG